MTRPFFSATSMSLHVNCAFKPPRNAPHRAMRVPKYLTRLALDANIPYQSPRRPNGKQSTAAVSIRVVTAMRRRRQPCPDAHRVKEPREGVGRMAAVILGTCKRFGFDGRSTARREWNRLKWYESESFAERQEGRKKNNIRVLSPNSLTLRADLQRSKMRVIRQLAAANLTNRSCNKPNERVAFTEVHTQFKATDVLAGQCDVQQVVVVKRGIYSTRLSQEYSTRLCNIPSCSTMVVNIPEKPEAEHRVWSTPSYPFLLGDWSFSGSSINQYRDVVL
ncbi:hypothetical protein DFH06DRAFT_1306675, partial [Mycena polygramma]